MRIEKAIEIIIELALQTGTNGNLPSIKQLTEMYGGSRGVYQKAIRYLTENQLVELSITNQGTTVEAINSSLILEKFYTNLLITIPYISLDANHDQLTQSIIAALSTRTDSNLYFRYTDSSLNRIESLTTNDSQLAIVSDTYYDSLGAEEFVILEKIKINTQLYAQIFVSDNPNNRYNLDEVPNVEKLTDDRNPIVQPTEYYLVCKSNIYSLLNDNEKRSQLVC